MRDTQKHKYEIFRIVTPALVTISIFILGIIWRSVTDMQVDVKTLQIDVAKLQERVNGR